MSGLRVTLVAINAMYVHTNLAVRCLHAAVQKALPEVAHTVLELHGNQPFPAQLRAIWATEPDVICFSTYIWNRERVLQLARALKRAIPGARVVLGGPEVSFDLSETLERHPCLDALVAGEGEESYPALLVALAGGAPFADDFPGVQGCAVRTARGVVLRNPPPPLPPERWPNPYPHGLDAEAERIWYLETSRGCPFQCQFCLSAGEKVRALPAERAVERLCALARGGAKLVKLVDRTFNYDAARAREIWRALLALDTECVFHFEIEAHLLDAESLDLLAAAPKGRFQFEIGVQSTTPEVLRAVRRGDHFAGIARAVRALREGDNIALHLDLIAGLPKESWASLARSFDDVHALRPHRLQLGFLKLLPGSGLRRDADALGLVYAPDPPYQVLSTPDLSFAELQALQDVDKALDWYGNSGRHQAVMELLTRHPSPFAAYHALALWLRSEGLFDADRSAAHRAEALERYADGLTAIDPDALRRAIEADRQAQAGYKRYRKSNAAG